MVKTVCGLFKLKLEVNVRIKPSMNQIDCRLCFKSGQNHIHLFDGSSHSSFVVSVINEHIGKVVTYT